MLVAALGAATSLGGSQIRTVQLAAPSGAQLSIDITNTGTHVVNDLLGLGSRVVLSTVAYKPRSEQRIALRNATSTPVHLKTIHFGGESPGSFALGNSQRLNARIDPGDDATVRVRFTPTKVGVQQAILTMVVDSRSPVNINVAGLNAPGFEGRFEPNLQQIFDALGYRVNVAMPKKQPTDINVPAEDRGNSIGTTNGAVGDEVLAPYFQQADKSKPVRLVPVAAYTARSTNTLGPFGINSPHDAKQTESLVSMRGGSDEWGGQNQQLLPGIGNGNFDALAPASKPSFTPSGAFDTFGIWDGTRSNYSDDSLNIRDPSGRKGQHNMRIYPAKRPNGFTINNAYLVAIDSGSADYKNYDYQDFVFLLANATPATP